MELLYLPKIKLNQKKWFKNYSRRQKRFIERLTPQKPSSESRKGEILHTLGPGKKKSRSGSNPGQLMAKIRDKILFSLQTFNITQNESIQSKVCSQYKHVKAKHGSLAKKLLNKIQIHQKSTKRKTMEMTFKGNKTRVYKKCIRNETMVQDVIKENAP